MNCVPIPEEKEFSSIVLKTSRFVFFLLDLNTKRISIVMFFGMGFCVVCVCVCAIGDGGAQSLPTEYTEE